MSLSEKLQTQLEELSLRIEREMYIVDADGYVVASTDGDLPQAGDLYPVESEWTADTLWDSEREHIYARFTDQQGQPLYLCMRIRQQQDVHLAYLTGRILKNELPRQATGPNREQLLRSLLMGRLSQAEMSHLSQEYHLPMLQTRCVILLEARPEHIGAVGSIMLQAAASRKDDWVVPISSRLAALVRVMRPDEERQELIQLAHALVDTLDNEYQLPARAYVGLPKGQLAQLSASFAEAQQAAKMAAQLSDEGTVFSYGRYLMEFFLEQMPAADVHQFYDKVQGFLVRDMLSPETEEMIRALFRTNLNISEAARRSGIHRNTLLYRLDKIQRATGLDLRCFDDAVIFKLLMQMGSHLRARHE